MFFFFTFVMKNNRDKDIIYPDKCLSYNYIKRIGNETKNIHLQYFIE